MGSFFRLIPVFLLMAGAVTSLRHGGSFSQEHPIPQRAAVPMSSNYIESAPTGAAARTPPAIATGITCLNRFDGRGSSTTCMPRR